MSNPIRRLASQTAVYGLSSMVGRLLNYLLTPLYTYAFAPESYGVVVELYTYTSFLAVLLTYGMETAYFRFMNQHPEPGDVFTTAARSLLVSTLLFVALALYSVPNLASALGYQQHPEYLHSFIGIIALDTLCTLPFARLRQEQKPLTFALLRLGNIGLNVLLNLFFIKWAPSITDGNATWWYNPNMGVGYIFLSNLIASAATTLCFLPMALRKTGHWNPALLKTMLGYAWPLLLAGLAGMINETLDRVLLKFLLPAGSNAMAQLGIYGACYKIAIILTIFIQTYRYAAEPFFFGHARETNSRQLYAKTMQIFVAVCVFIMLCTTLLMPVVEQFIGQSYRVGLSVVPILLLANACLGIYYNLSIWYKLSGKTRYGAYLTGIGALVTLVLNALLIPRMGYMGAAWATLACYATIMVVSFVWGQKHFPVPYQMGRLGTYALAMMLLYGMGNFILSHLATPIALALNAGLCMAFAGFAWKLEKAGMQGMVQVNK
jgi:O-antigen/teichoic acid export membrane protein